MGADTAQHQGEMTQRDRILGEAERLFLTKGFDATSIDMIVGCVRISKSDFYLHFQNRDDVFLAVARRLIIPPESFLPIIDGPLFDQLMILAPQLRNGQVQQPGIGILRAAIVANRFSPELARQVYLARASRAENMARLLNGAATRDGAHFDNAELCAYRFAAVATDGLRHLAGMVMPSEEDQRVYARHITYLFLYGYADRRTGPARESPRAGHDWEKHGWISPQPVLPELPVTRKSMDRWNAVLDEAWAAFSQCGYDAASMDSMSERAGLPKNTIYRRFGSKAGLFLFTAQRRIDMILAAPVKLETDGGDGRPLLASVMLDMQKRFCSDDCLPLSRILIIEAGNDPAMTSMIYEYLVQQIVEKLSPVIDLLIQKEIVADGIAVDLAAWHIFVLATFGSRLLFIPPKDSQEQLDLATEAAEQFLFGIFRP